MTANPLLNRAARRRVLGIGSPWGADRAGLLAIEYLRSSDLPARFPGICFESLDRPGARLLEHLQGAEQVVIIDAVCGGRPGRVRHLSLADLAHTQLTSSHGFGVAEALGLAQALDALPPRLGIIGIEVGDGTIEPETFDYRLLADAVAEVLAHNG